MLGFTGFLGLTRISFFLLTQISQIPRYCFVGGKSHRCFCAWAGSHEFHFAFGLTRISQIPQYCFVGGKSHRCFCVWAGSHGFHLIFRLTRISQIPRFSFVGGKSHRCFCAWACVGSDGGTLLSLSRIYFSDPSDKSDLSDLSDKLDIFKNNP